MHGKILRKLTVRQSYQGNGSVMKVSARFSGSYPFDGTMKQVTRSHLKWLNPLLMPKKESLLNRTEVVLQIDTDRITWQLSITISKILTQRSRRMDQDVRGLTIGEKLKSKCSTQKSFWCCCTRTSNTADEYLEKYSMEEPKLQINTTL